MKNYYYKSAFWQKRRSTYQVRTVLIHQIQLSLVEPFYNDDDDGYGYGCGRYGYVVVACVCCCCCCCCVSSSLLLLLLWLLLLLYHIQHTLITSVILPLLPRIQTNKQFDIQSCDDLYESHPKHCTNRLDDPPRIYTINYTHYYLVSKKIRRWVRMVSKIWNYCPMVPHNSPVGWVCPPSGVPIVDSVNAVGATVVSLTTWRLKN